MYARGKLLPFYLVIDVSYSMDGPKLARANGILPTIVDALAQNPIISDKVRFGLLDFSDDARVQLPLCDPLDPHLVLPGLAPRGATSYAAAFGLLRQVIAYDVAQLKADGFAVHRPAVFFVSDGEPSEPENVWRREFDALTCYDAASGRGFAMYPNIIPFGIDQADPRALQSVIHPAGGPKPMRMFLADRHQDPALAVTAIAEILVSSVLASGGGLAGGGSGIVLPSDADLPAGMRSVAPGQDFL